MANSTPRNGSTAEPALSYDSGERRTHAEHAAEAYFWAGVANGEYSADRPVPDGMTAEEAWAWVGASNGRLRTADEAMERAKWHATMATYEALRELKG